MAMLVGERSESQADVIVVVEDDALQSQAIHALQKLRSSGMSGELLASGSPRKRFDKAVKANPWAVVAFSMRDGVVSCRIKGDVPIQAEIEKILS